MADESTPAVDAAPAETAPVVPVTTPAVEAQVTEADSVEKLPKWAQKLVSDLRQENASHRTAKTKAERDAAEAARKAAEEQGEFKKLYETEKASREAAELRAKAAELDRIKTRIGARLALPAELQDRLRGETEEEIEADAKILLAAIPKPAAITTTDATQGINGAAPTQRYSDAEIKEMAARYGVGFEALKSQLVK